MNERTADFLLNSFVFGLDRDFVDCLDSAAQRPGFCLQARSGGAYYAWTDDVPQLGGYHYLDQSDVVNQEVLLRSLWS